MGTYTARISWERGADSSALFVRNQYHRAHQWAFDGGATVPASSSPQHVRVPFSDPAGVDPEEAFIAALSICHMLFFLHLAARAGWVVDAYADDAEGVMGTDDAGRTAMAGVTLRPHITFGGDAAPTVAEIAALHHESHDLCYIANSVRCPVVVEAGE